MRIQNPEFRIRYGGHVDHLSGECVGQAACAGVVWGGHLSKAGHLWTRPAFGNEAHYPTKNNDANCSHKDIEKAMFFEKGRRGAFWFSHSRASSSCRTAGRRITLKKFCGLYENPDSPASSNFAPRTPHSVLPTTAFSLLEIVVSTAIVAILSLIMLQILSKMLDASKIEMARMDAYANGRAVLDMMSRDIGQTWVEQSSNGNRTVGSWSGIPPGTEMNWRSIYVRFNNAATSTDLVSYLANTNVNIILYSGAIPVTRGSSGAGLRAVGYSLSNGVLYRYQTLLLDSGAAANGLNAAEGVTNSDFSIIKYTDAVNNREAVAGNIYWMKIDGAGGSDATNQLPSYIKITMRTASPEIMERIKRNGNLATNLYLSEMITTNGADFTNGGIREISMKIPMGQ